MKRLKSLWLTLTGSVSSLFPVLFACCKSGACVGVCASPVASLFGISTAGIASSPVMSALEPLLIALSAVSFTVSYYTLYVLPKFATCNSGADCACGPNEKEQNIARLSKRIFWVGLIVSVSFLTYFDYQKYQSNVAAVENSSCDSAADSGCCPEGESEEAAAENAACESTDCCDTSATHN